VGEARVPDKQLFNEVWRTLSVQVVVSRTCQDWLDPVPGICLVSLECRVGLTNLVSRVVVLLWLSLLLSCRSICGSCIGESGDLGQNFIKQID